MKERSTRAIVGSIIMDVVGLVFANTVLLWNQYTNGVLLNSWADYLWAANLSIIVALVGHIVFLFYRPARAYLLILATIMSASLVSTIAFLAVFPFDFAAIGAAWLNGLLTGIVIFVIAVSVLGIVVNIVKAAKNERYSGAES